jgi:alkanesulfonate monooxygenase SsuD/methylene tetrahydromethanopterin reductase-like flavin-dependent oxidoreductase (luciferase family)
VAQPLRFGVAYDFRNPPDGGMSNPEMYARVLAQAELVDRLGYDSIWITEHHFVDDGYVPSFVAVAGAIAARTLRVRISSDVLLLPFAHPLRLAEDLAVLDNLSGGRMELGVGMGYAPHEFRAFGIPRAERVSRMEEGLEVLKLAWAGEPFDFRGRHWSFEGARVRPLPVQRGGPPLWVAAMSRAGALRAARHGANLLPQGDRREVLDPWREALGKDASGRRVGIIRSWLVTDDKERDWPPIREGERYKARLYEKWLRESGDDVTSALAGKREDAHPIPQTWIVGGPAECRAEIARFVREFGITDLVTMGVVPGVAPEVLSQSLERFAHEVMPWFRDE